MSEKRDTSYAWLKACVAVYLVVAWMSSMADARTVGAGLAYTVLGGLMLFAVLSSKPDNHD